MERNNITCFESREDLINEVITKHNITKELGKGTEGTCYLGTDDKVYKIMHPNYERETGIIYNINKIITTKDIELEHFALPEELYTIRKRLMGYKTKYFFPDLFDLRNIKTNPNQIYQIEFYKLLKSYYLMIKEIERLSQENILIYDLPSNLIFTGEKLVAIDTLGYKRVTQNPLEQNKNYLDISILWELNMMLEYNNIISEEQLSELINTTEVEKYINKLSKILKK